MFWHNFLKLSKPAIQVNSYNTRIRSFNASVGNLSKNENANTADRAVTSEPDLPINCCMSNCQNCVWLEYAESLLKHYGSVDAKNLDKVLKEIEKLSDENLKSYLLMEIKFKFR